MQPSEDEPWPETFARLARQIAEREAEAQALSREFKALKATIPPLERALAKMASDAGDVRVAIALGTSERKQLREIMTFLDARIRKEEEARRGGEEARIRADERRKIEVRYSRDDDRASIITARVLAIIGAGALGALTFHEKLLGP